MTFEEFFRERYGEVVRSMRLLVGDPARAEEHAQEAFTRACRRWDHVRTLDRPVAWVYVVATNEARREWRREQRAAVSDGQVTPTVDDSAGTVATALDVRAALARLTGRQRAAVVLRYGADLPLADIAEVMGCSVGTAKATLHQALARMRIALEAEHADD